MLYRSKLLTSVQRKLQIWKYNLQLESLLTGKCSQRDILSVRKIKLIACAGI